MSCWSIAELTAGALACSDERSVSVVLNASEGSPGNQAGPSGVPAGRSPFP
ncbi:hypothetical protein F511_15165 [Dorcoceras hygrometricum]|uniref:Uncharacterized protein n=1 Tax=Dorcoceras hygrometricum TaxID=472368 RepID=A0A2Z7BBE6_9LAMI|nr:hypothetical protein F511_15165 [Dorcoceras hygrometricum]